LCIVRSSGADVVVCQERKQEFILDLVKTFAFSNTPLSRIEFFVPFIHKWIPHYGGVLPEHTHYDTIWLPRLAPQLKDALKAEIAGKPCSITIDETPDAKSRCVFNIIVSVDGKHLLARTAFEGSVDGPVVARLVIDIAKDFGIQYEHLDAVATDSAAYNLSAFS
jgi:hypothetical protein